MKRLSMWLVSGAAAASAVMATTPALADSPRPDMSGAFRAALSATRPAQATAGRMTPLWRTTASTPRVAPDSIGEPGGYDPDELRAYLGLKGTGHGQTVAIVEAYDVSAAVTEAVATYDDYYGLKPACSDTVTSNCFPLTFSAPAGTQVPTDPNGLLTWLSFQVEADLDVELVHAIAPDAAITVVEGFDNTDTSLLSAIDSAASLHPAAISDSFGEPEYAGEQAGDGHCRTAGALCVFSSGDDGNPGSYPAANPDVLAVGGTTLDAGPTGQVRSEVAWVGSGGGVSPFEPRPRYQARDPYRGGRGVPDVSFDADPDSGIAAYVVRDVPDYGYHEENWAVFGGTSMGAPAWSAILAAADQLRTAKGRPHLTTAQVHAAVYAKSPKGLADITVGANGICGDVCSASTGYDLVTGEGSPRPGIDTYLARQ